MATYTVVETIHHGSFHKVSEGSGPDLDTALRDVLTRSAYYPLVDDDTAFLVGLFTMRGFADCLLPSVEHGWATYRLTITPSPED